MQRLIATWNGAEASLRRRIEARKSTGLHSTARRSNAARMRFSSSRIRETNMATAGFPTMVYRISFTPVLLHLRSKHQGDGVQGDDLQLRRALRTRSDFSDHW